MLNTQFSTLTVTGVGLTSNTRIFIVPGACNEAAVFSTAIVGATVTWRDKVPSVSADQTSATFTLNIAFPTARKYRICWLENDQHKDGFYPINSEMFLPVYNGELLAYLAAYVYASCRACMGTTIIIICNR
jgi:hypothetical protein